MAGKRKPPRLREKQGCFVADIYKPDGTRTTISFGSAGQRTEGEIYAAFGKWLDLFNQHPHKALALKSPYEAIDAAINCSTILSVGDLFSKYVEWAGNYLLPLRDGRDCPELLQVRRLEKFLQPYSDWRVADFGPDELRIAQQAMVDYRYFRGKQDGNPTALGRSSINRMINQIHKMWQWGIGREITTQAQAHLLREVRPLRAGRTTAKDQPKRRPVTKEELQSVVASLTTVVADMIRLIWITAMRPSEVCRMRPFDILREDPECWLYVPGRDAGPVGDHKTAQYRRTRAIPLTREAQTILKGRITDVDSMAFVFSPAGAVREMRERRFALRQTPMGQGSREGSNRQPRPMINPGDRYGAHSLNNAVKRACKRAGVERFTLYDLRRTAATRVRSKLSKDAAKLLLGHVSSTTTEIYLLEEVQEAMKVAKKLELQGG